MVDSLKWAQLGSNQRPPDYESGAANHLSYGPYFCPGFLAKPRPPKPCFVRQRFNEAGGAGGWARFIKTACNITYLPLILQELTEKINLNFILLPESPPVTTSEPYPHSD